MCRTRLVRYVFLPRDATTKGSMSKLVRVRLCSGGRSVMLQISRNMMPSTSESPLNS